VRFYRVGFASDSSAELKVVIFWEAVKGDGELDPWRRTMNPDADSYSLGVRVWAYFTPTTIGVAVYVAPDGQCDGNNPCYSTIQEAIDNAETGSVIRILHGIYNEDIIIDQTYGLTLSGGWDSTFTTQSSTTIINSMTLSDNSGTTEIDNLVLQ
jgi:pectin methylesterase-like acyl-CoA thioesterase